MKEIFQLSDSPTNYVMHNLELEIATQGVISCAQYLETEKDFNRPDYALNTVNKFIHNAMLIYEEDVLNYAVDLSWEQKLSTQFISFFVKVIIGFEDKPMNIKIQDEHLSLTSHICKSNSSSSYRSASLIAATKIAHKHLKAKEL